MMQLALASLGALGLSLATADQPSLVPVDRTSADASADQEPEVSCSHTYTVTNSSTNPDYELAFGVVQDNVVSAACPVGEFCTWDIVVRYDIHPTDPTITKQQEIRKWHHGGTASGPVTWGINPPGGGGSFVKPDGNGGYVPQPNPSSEGHMRLTGQGPNCASSTTFTATSVGGTCTVSLTITTSCLVSVTPGEGEEDGPKPCH